MELNKTHRLALLLQLKAAESDERICSNLLAQACQHQETAPMSEIDHYLAKERIRIISEALIENQIDY